MGLHPKRKQVPGGPGGNAFDGGRAKDLADLERLPADPAQRKKRRRR